MLPRNAQQIPADLDDCLETSQHGLNGPDDIVRRQVNDGMDNNRANRPEQRSQEHGKVLSINRWSNRVNNGSRQKRKRQPSLSHVSQHGSVWLSQHTADQPMTN